MLLKPTCTHEEAFFTLLRQLTGRSGSFAKPADHRRSVWLIVGESTAHVAIRLLIGFFGRSLCYVVVRPVGTWFVGGRSLLGSDPGHSARLARHAAIGQLVRIAALHG